MCIGVRTVDNCYGLTPSISNKCFSAKIDQVDLWHQRLGHASHKQLEKISKCDAVVGLPKFGKIDKCICGPCQIGKQIKSKHPSVEVYKLQGLWSFFTLISWVLLEFRV